MTRAVTTITGMALVAGSDLSARVTSIPLTSGRWMSMRIIVGSLLAGQVQPLETGLGDHQVPRRVAYDLLEHQDVGLVVLHRQDGHLRIVHGPGDGVGLDRRLGERSAVGPRIPG